MTRLLGVDLGTRRIGLAVGDMATHSVTPLATIRRGDHEDDAQKIARLISEQRIDELVVGLPLNMDGSEGERATDTREWAGAMQEMCAVPLSLRDERLTTERAIETAGSVARGKSGGPPSPKARRAYRARLDRLAAAAIVQAEIDARRAMPETAHVAGDS